MHDSHAEGATAALTAAQRAIVDFAARDLDSARAADLAAISAAALILLVERLRMRLDDMLNLVQELGEDPYP